MATDPVTLPAGIEPRAAFDRLTSQHLALAPVVDGERLVGVLTRTGALRATLYAPAVDADGQLMVAAADRHQRRRRGQGEGAAGHRADVLVVDTAHGHQDRMLEP